MAAKSSRSHPDPPRTDRGSVGIDHVTVVPTNFDPEGAVCPSCGRPFAEH